MDKLVCKFIENLKNIIQCCYGGGEQKDWDNLITEIDSLGYNAKRMLNIGILQDKLVKLGFSPRETSNLIPFALFESGKGPIKKCYGISFNHEYASVLENRDTTNFYYDSEDFIERVMSKVRELIKSDTTS